MANQPAGYYSETIADATDTYWGRSRLTCGFAHYRTLLHDGRTNRRWGDEGGVLPLPVMAIGAQRKRRTACRRPTHSSLLPTMSHPS